MQSFETYVDVLKAAAEPNRLRILALCAQGELTVSEITRILGQSQPGVSRHLKVLLTAGLLMRFREKHSVLYRACAEGSPARVLMNHLLSSLPDDAVVRSDERRLAQIKAERAAEAARYLRFNSEDWASLRDSNVSDAQINRAIVEHIDTEQLGDLLDIGTGTGRILKLLGNSATTAVGVDISPNMLTVARSELHAAGLDNVMVRQADMYALPFAAAAFDTVTVDQVLFQAERPQEVLIEAARLLREDGQLLIVDFARPAGKLPPGAAQSIGLSADDLEHWLSRAGLNAHSTRSLEGESLTVTLTVASRHGRAERAA